MPELPIVNVVCCPPVVVVRLTVPPLLGLTVQFTGILAENASVAPATRLPALEGVMLTGGTRLIVAVPATPLALAVIVAVRGLFGIGLATVNVTF